MDLFLNAKVVKLRSHHDKYLVAEEDEESVIQSRNGSSRNALWTVELEPNSQSVIRLQRALPARHHRSQGGPDVARVVGAH
jgi:hypothetical protein